MTMATVIVVPMGSWPGKKVQPPFPDQGSMDPSSLEERALASQCHFPYPSQDAYKTVSVHQGTSE